MSKEKSAPPPKGDPPKEDPPEVDPPKDDPPKGRTYTQDEVDALDKKLQTAARRKADEELAEKLGVPVEEAATMIAEALEAKEKLKTDADKAKEEADAASAKAASELAAVKVERLELAIQRALIVAGEDPAKEPALGGEERLMSVAMAIAMPHALAAEDDDQAAVVQAAVKHTRELAPEIFGVSAGDSSNGKPPPGAPPPNRKGGEHGTNHGAGTPEAKAAAIRLRRQSKRKSPMAPRNPPS